MPLALLHWQVRPAGLVSGMGDATQSSAAPPSQAQAAAPGLPVTEVRTLLIRRDSESSGSLRLRFRFLRNGGVPWPPAQVPENDHEAIPGPGSDAPAGGGVVTIDIVSPSVRCQ